MFGYVRVLRLCKSTVEAPLAESLTGRASARLEQGLEREFSLVGYLDVKGVFNHDSPG